MSSSSRFFELLHNAKSNTAGMQCPHDDGPFSRDDSVAILVQINFSGSPRDWQPVFFHETLRPHPKSLVRRVKRPFAGEIASNFSSWGRINSSKKLIETSEKHGIDLWILTLAARRPRQCIVHRVGLSRLDG